MQTQEPLFLELTAFSGSIQELNRRIYMVPVGWQKVYFNMILQLQAINCRARGKIELWGAAVEDAEMDITFSKDDPVIDGILRKTVAKMKLTCEICGRPGHHVEVNAKPHYLCTKCHAPHLLKSQIDDFLKKIDDDGFAEKNCILSRDSFDNAFLKLIPDSEWSRVKSFEHGIDVDCITFNKLAKLKPRLSAVRSFLAKRISEHA
jgi:hypothetical protein